MSRDSEDEKLRSEEDAIGIESTTDPVKEDRGRKKKKKRSRSRSPSSSSDSDSSRSSSSSSERKKKKSKKKKSKKDKKKKSKKDKKDKKKSKTKHPSSSSSKTVTTKKTVMSESLLAKLAERNETLEERRERKERERNAQMAAKFGYSNDENPFNDPNLNESFSWGKKLQQKKGAAIPVANSGAEKKAHQEKLVSEIEKVRRRRIEREEEFEEMNRLREEESRLREMAHYDDWQRKEEEFHLAQQHQRTAIRLVEGREKPIDVLAKNVLLFGMSDEDKANKAAVKYKERYNALEEMGNLEAELTPPHEFLRDLKLEELEELKRDIVELQELEKEAGGAAGKDGPLKRYWDALSFVCNDEIEWIRGGGAGGAHESVSADIRKMFEGQTKGALRVMEEEIRGKISPAATAVSGLTDNSDANYWKSVLTQLRVHLAKGTLTEIHDNMLMRQLSKIETRKKELKERGRDATAVSSSAGDNANDTGNASPDAQEGDTEEALAENDEIDLSGKSFGWADKYKPRKPRYFNRVKTGWDWNKYNQTHYDHDNPPPKVVQGYKFSIFYPDLIDKTKTPQFFIEPADSPEFCIIRFHGGAPYEDIAFKILNKEWARTKKRGFKCTFDRGVLTLFFNFSTHWYRR